jgi:hypothetical protein
MDDLNEVLCFFFWAVFQFIRAASCQDALVPERVKLIFNTSSTAHVLIHFGFPAFISTGII